MIFSHQLQTSLWIQEQVHYQIDPPMVLNVNENNISIKWLDRKMTNKRDFTNYHHDSHQEHFQINRHQLVLLQMQVQMRHFQKVKEQEL